MQHFPLSPWLPEALPISHSGQLPIDCKDCLGEGRIAPERLGFEGRPIWDWILQFLPLTVWAEVRYLTLISFSSLLSKWEANWDPRRLLQQFNDITVSLSKYLWNVYFVDDWDHAGCYTHNREKAFSTLMQLPITRQRQEYSHYK